MNQKNIPSNILKKDPICNIEQELKYIYDAIQSTIQNPLSSLHNKKFLEEAHQQLNEAKPLQTKYTTYIQQSKKDFLNFLERKGYNKLQQGFNERYEGYQEEVQEAHNILTNTLCITLIQINQALIKQVISMTENEANRKNHQN